MPLTKADFAAVLLTLELASLTTLLLLLIGTPIAWWLARTQSKWKQPIGAIVALPLVLPPTVIGFYLLVSMGPHGFIGQLTQSLGLGTLTSAVVLNARHLHATGIPPALSEATRERIRSAMQALNLL